MTIVIVSIRIRLIGCFFLLFEYLGNPNHTTKQRKHAYSDQQNRIDVHGIHVYTKKSKHQRTNAKKHQVDHDLTDRIQ